jgi:hypothetical protein
MWIRYAVTTAGDVIREDARTTAEMSEIVISEISGIECHWNQEDYIWR